MKRLIWLDIARVLCAVLILSVHWLHAAFNVGMPIHVIIHYQFQNGGWRQFLEALPIAGTAWRLDVVLTDALGLFGQFGWEAVSALIIISGFSLAVSQRTPRHGLRPWGAWYEKRARRILLPFYLIALPLLAACGIALRVLPLLHSHAAELLQTKLESQFHTPLAGVILSHLVLFDPWGFHWSGDFFAPAWWFVPAILVAYAAYPFLLAASRAAHGIPLLLAAAGVTMVSYAIASTYALANETWYYIILQECFNFCLGIVLANAWNAGARERLEGALRDPRALPVAFALFVAGNVANDATWSRPVASMLYGPALLVLVCHVAMLLERRRAGKFLTRFDPYDLYLVHQPFAFPIAIAAKAVFHGYGVVAGWVAFCAVVMLVTRALSAAQGAVFNAGRARRERRATNLRASLLTDG